MQSLFFLCLFVLATSFWMPAKKERNVSVIASLGHLFLFFFPSSFSPFCSFTIYVLVWFCCQGCALVVVTANHRVSACAMGGSNPHVSRADLTEGQYRAWDQSGMVRVIFMLPSYCPRHFFPHVFFFFWKTRVWLQPAKRGSGIQHCLQLGSTWQIVSSPKRITNNKSWNLICHRFAALNVLLLLLEPVYQNRTRTTTVNSCPRKTPSL